MIPSARKSFRNTKSHSLSTGFEFSAKKTLIPYLMAPVIGIIVLIFSVNPSKVSQFNVAYGALR
jgi:hypothetical protein